MSAETNPGKTYTASEKGFQRLLLREYKDQSRPGDGLKRAGLNLTILAGATAADLGESHLVDKLIRDPLDRKIDTLKEKISHENTVWDYKMAHKDVYDMEALKAGHEADLIKKLEPARSMQGKKFAAEFVEEWLSDSVYAGVANSWVRYMTGVDGVKYVTETSAFLADWGNAISQVFMGDKLYPTKFVDANGKATKWHGIKKAYQTMDFINPVNVEAAFRVIEEIPVVGDGVAWLHEKSDKLLESAVARWGNTAAAKAILGFHIGKNVKPL